MIRVLIVADIRLYRDGLALMLSHDPLLAVVGTAASLEEAVAASRTLHPEIMLLDCAMPDGLRTVHAVSDVASDVRIVALAMPETEGDVVACAEAGVAGYVSRDASCPDLVSTLVSVARGEFPCSPRMAASLLRRVATLASRELDAATGASLTLREQGIVAMIDRGCSNKDIARRLGIEVATVKNHVHNILEKLHVHRRGEAAARVRMRRPLPSLRSLAETPKV